MKRHRVGVGRKQSLAARITRAQARFDKLVADNVRFSDPRVKTAIAEFDDAVRQYRAERAKGRS